MKKYYIDFLHEPHEPVEVKTENMDDAIILAKAERIKKGLNHEYRAVTEGDEVATVEVYSREECVFNYCPTPELCRNQNKCRCGE